MNITVFGGASPLPGESAYLEAMRLGRLLGAAGHTVLTGGYIGVMEAVSRGASEAGGHVIGVTCREIEAWRKIGPNPWVKEEWRFDTLRERLFALIDGCQAALAMPGGAGTLGEIALMWNQMITASIPPRPLILIGSGWQAAFEQIFTGLDEYISIPDRRFLSFSENVDAAVRELNLQMENRI